MMDPLSLVSFNIIFTSSPPTHRRHKIFREHGHEQRDWCVLERFLPNCRRSLSLFASGAVMNVFASAGSGSGSSNDPKVSRNLHAPSASGSGVPIILNFERYTVRSVDSASGLEQWNVSITKLSSAALNPPAAPHLQDADGEFIDSLFFSTSGNALQAISKANRSVVWSQVLSAGATAVWYVPDGASAQEKLLVPLVSSAILEGSDHGNVNDAESLRDAVLMSTKEGGGQIVVLDSHEGALLVRNEPSFFHHLRHDPNAIGGTQNYASIESPGKNGNAIVVSSSASQSSSSGLSNIENSFSRIQSCVLGKVRLHFQIVRCTFSLNCTFCGRIASARFCTSLILRLKSPKHPHPLFRSQESCFQRISSLFHLSIFICCIL
jgi:hypothetical protein